LNIKQIHRFIKQNYLILAKYILCVINTGLQELGGNYINALGT